MCGGFDEYPGHPDSTVAHRCIRGCDVFCVPHNGQNVEEALDHFRIYCRLVCPIHSAFSSGMGGIATRFRSTQFRKLHQASCPARTHLLRSEQACTESKPAPKTNLHQKQTCTKNKQGAAIARCPSPIVTLLCRYCCLARMKFCATSRTKSTAPAGTSTAPLSTVSNFWGWP